MRESQSRSWMYWFNFIVGVGMCAMCWKSIGAEWEWMTVRTNTPDPFSEAKYFSMVVVGLMLIVIAIQGWKEKARNKVILRLLENDREVIKQ